MSRYKEEVALAGRLADGGDPDGAMEICSRVLLDEPDNVGALFVTCVVLLHAARHVQVIQVAKRLVELKPKASPGWTMLAAAYAEIHRYDESIRYAEKALACRRDAKTVADMGYVHTNAGNWIDGEKWTREAIAIASGDSSDRAVNALRDALVNLTYCELALGRWRSGWEGYRRTMRTKWRKEWEYNGSIEWSGEPDAVVMVTGEQGLGDEIMAVSVVPDAIRSCKAFVLDCDERLGAIFARSFPNAIVTPTRRERNVELPPGSPSPTHHKSLFGLSELFRNEDSDFPRTPYLVPREDYVRMFRGLFADIRTIGLAWSGGLLRTGQEPRMAGLNAFLPLMRRGEAQFVSLQYTDDAAEVAALKRDHGIDVIRVPWATAKGGDVDVLAGLVGACDEVVGVHTSALHLASAIGTPTTFLAHKGSGWRYGPDELLWYGPATKLHKKRPGESWRECIGRLVEARK